MALRTIIQIGDPVLRKKCFEVTDFGEKTLTLLGDMKETLAKSGGIGLAAPQVGVLRRIFIVDYEGEFYECINPVIISKKGKCDDMEGCLSVKGQYGIVERPRKITIKYQDRFGKEHTKTFEGYTARVFCHENDHLDGILYVDIAKTVENEEN